MATQGLDGLPKGDDLSNKISVDKVLSGEKVSRFNSISKSQAFTISVHTLFYSVVSVCFRFASCCFMPFPFSKAMACPPTTLIK